MAKPPIHDAEWRSVAPTYIWVEVVSGVIWTVISLIVTGILFAVREDTSFAWIIALAIAVVFLIGTIMNAFYARSIRYALREDDLLVKRGVMSQEIVAVPYGRMQVVDVERSFFQRMFGLSELTMVTAASGAKANIPGLKQADADELRDHLVRVAESRRAGL